MFSFCKINKSSKIILFFFSSRRRHTRSYGDWSSDVCSSDLLGTDPGTNALTATASISGSVESVRFTATGQAEAVLRNVIIYTTEGFGLPDVAIVRPDGSCRRRLTTGDAAYAAPAISPDGRRIA